jgi:hypothetical protein
MLGEQVVVVGMGEVEHDDRRRKWQPHWHLMIYNVSWARLQAFRKKHYSAQRRGPRPMVRSRYGEPATWFSYMSKLIAFGKVPVRAGSLRVRLNNRLSREYFRYLADRSPTSFLFCLNCSLLNRTLADPLECDDDRSAWCKRPRRQARGYTGQGGLHRPSHTRYKYKRRSQPSRSTKRLARLAVGRRPVAARHDRVSRCRD